MMSTKKTSPAKIYARNSNCEIPLVKTKRLHNFSKISYHLYSIIYSCNSQRDQSLKEYKSIALNYI